VEHSGAKEAIDLPTKTKDKAFKTLKVGSNREIQGLDNTLGGRA